MSEEERRGGTGVRRRAEPGLAPLARYLGIDFGEAVVRGRACVRASSPWGCASAGLPGLTAVAAGCWVGADAEDAQTGFDFRARRVFPIHQGIVVCAEHAATLLAVRRLVPGP